MSICILALLDTFLCNENNLRRVEEYLREMHRVVKTTGTFLIISHGIPQSRLDFFNRDFWDVEVVEIGTGCRL